MNKTAMRGKVVYLLLMPFIPFLALGQGGVSLTEDSVFEDIHFSGIEPVSCYFVNNSENDISVEQHIILDTLVYPVYYLKYVMYPQFQVVIFSKEPEQYPRQYDTRFTLPRGDSAELNGFDIDDNPPDNLVKAARTHFHILKAEKNTRILDTTNDTMTFKIVFSFNKKADTLTVIGINDQEVGVEYDKIRNHRPKTVSRSTKLGYRITIAGRKLSRDISSFGISVLHSGDNGILLSPLITATY